MGQTLRVVLDTNVLLSGIAFPGSIPGKSCLPGGWVASKSFFRISSSKSCAGSCPGSHRHGLTSAEIDDLLDILSIQAEILTPHVPDEQLLRDTNDLPVLGTLLAAVRAGNIDYLLTGDKDLLVLADRYPIISPADFWARHGGL